MTGGKQSQLLVPRLKSGLWTYDLSLTTSSVDGWVGGWVDGCPVIIVPLCGSILQAETCQILSLAENPRWSPSVAKLGHMSKLGLPYVPSILIWTKVS